MSNKIKTGDNVIVVTGKDRGKIGKVLKVSLKTNKILVSGVALLKKSGRKGDSEGFTYKESFISYSNVMHLDPKLGKPSRVGFKILSDGRKVRFYKKSGELLG